MIHGHAVDIVSLAADLRRGEVPLLAYLDELENHFASIEPKVHAFLPEAGRFDRLRAAAHALLVRFPNENDRPPLFGVPVGIKDIIRVDGFPTRAGASIPPDLLQGPQAECVTRLLGAGVLILGKTVTTEFAYFHPGPTRNPHNLAHTPGGSSSGSAAAVAARLAGLTLGSQTIGSIIRPAAYCGVVGFKPSYDRLSRQGVIPLAPSVDHVGIFSSGVLDTNLAASVLCRDWRSVERPPRPVLGIPAGPYLRRASQEGLDEFENAHRKLASAGYEIRLVPALEDFLSIEAAHHTIVAAEASQVHAAWFAKHHARYHTRTAELIRRGHGVTAADLQAALQGRQAFRDYLITLMRSAGIDLWISPAAPGPAPHGLDSTGDPVMNLPWTYSGLPAITIPTGGKAAGLPFGLQIVGNWNRDEILLACAVEMEQVLRLKEI
jgi:Asp-tRNA(Asn)/Glu-tRNA(Gln) amidotransferase A subunit family amidase